MRTNFNCLKIFAAIIPALLLGGCMIPKSSIEDLSGINKATDVIIVGRIEMVPKIAKEEVAVKMTIGGDELYRQFMLRVKNDVGETTNYTTDVDNMVVVKTEEDYYISSDRSEPFRIFGGWFYTELHGGAGIATSTVLYRIKGGVQVEIPKGADAVYVGDIKFKRDEFFNLKDISFSQDDFEAAQKRFQKKFKTKMHLVKAKITAVKQ